MSKNKHWLIHLPKIIGGLILIGVIGGIIYLLTTFEQTKPEKKKKIQAITVVKPPPPPPPPPKVEKIPEPKVEEKIEEPSEPEPEETPEQAEDEPAGDTGLDAEGTAGSDSFGLVGKKGGRGLFGGSGNPYGWYNKVIVSGLQSLLSEREELRRKGYSAIVKLWLEADGSIKRYELVRGSNDSGIDDILNHQLSKYKKVGEAPPPGMEQPIKIKITSRV